MTPLIYAAILVLGTVSTVAAYAGITIVLPHDDLWYKLFAAAVASAIGIAVAAFWHTAFQAVLKAKQRRLRLSGWAVVFVGAVVIAGMSAYWHVAALGYSTVRTEAIYETLDKGERALTDAGKQRTVHQPFASRLAAFSADVGELAACEAATGCVTGTAGMQGVYGTLIAVQGKINGIVLTIADDDERLGKRLAEGGKCLADFRKALATGTEADGGTAMASAAFDCVNSAIAEVESAGQMERIAQEMESLTMGIIMPVSIKTPAQRQAVENILSGFRDRAAAIAKDAKAAVKLHEVMALVLERMSPMLAVVVHWKAIVPVWIAALALDLFPIILLAFQAILVASRRELPDAPDHEFTAADLIKALATTARLQEAAKPRPAEPLMKTIDNEDHAANRISYRRDKTEPDYWEEEVELGEDGDADNSEGGA